ncbi:pyridoxamine 5'-phosphate oxidase family protein [Ascidiaceihabitans sp.]|uniref:pyridoxamine 5'-phosphate oxidase family protein n=1 Tax=Ascidiaceihabitans sp. TaxID=1872644 RepID=UPI0032984295
MSHHLKEEFWDCIEDAREGVLSSGFGRTVPMSHYANDDEDGKDDPNLQLVPLDLAKAEVWATEGKLAFLYEVAKANLTDDTANPGHHGTIVFRKAA